MKYYVTSGEQSREIEIEGEMARCDGAEWPARIDSIAGTPFHVLTLAAAVHVLVAKRGDRRGLYDVSIGGFRMTVEALDERSKAIRELSHGLQGSTGPTHLVAPMPGLIVRVNVQEGDAVQAGQGLVVMEAMKMENELKATAAGVVRKVLVSAGGAVEKGALLLEIE